MTSTVSLIDITTEFCNITKASGTNLSTSLVRPPLFSDALISAYNIFLYCMIALGVPGNLIVLIVFFKHPPCTSTDWFLVFITSYDFVTAIIHIPIYASFTNGTWQLFGSNVLCKLHMFTSQSIVLSSSFLIFGLALDRYCKVCHPNRRMFTTRKSKLFCICVTCVMVIFSIPSYLMAENVGQRCGALATNRMVFVYYLLVFLSFLIATITFIVSYVCVARSIIRSEQNVRRHNPQFIAPSPPSYWSVVFCCKKSYRHHRVEPIFTSSASVSYLTRTAIGTTMPATEQSIVSSDGRLAPPPHIQQAVHDVTETSVTSSSQTPDVTKRKNRRRAQLGRQKMTSTEDKRTVSLRTTKIAFLVCFVFVVSWIPPWVSFLIATSPTLLAKKGVLEFIMFGKMTHVINTVTNPFLYTGLNRKFRNQAKDVLLCTK